MKIKKIWSIITFVILATFVIGCSFNGNDKLSKGEFYNISTTQVEHAFFKVVNREESVDSAREGQKLFVSIVFEQGYELDKVYVNDVENEGVTFVMPSADTNVTITVKEIISNITVEQSEGGTISCDKTSARYGDIIKITVTPDSGYYINVRGLKVNTAEVSVPPIYKETTFEYVMPHTDIKITAQFLKTNLNRGAIFGDYDHKTLAKNGNKWDYTTENEVHVSLAGTGDAKEKRDVAFTYYLEKSNYFYFSTAVQIYDFNIPSTDENRIGIFFGDGNKMGTVGYYFKKYSSSDKIFIGRKYTSLNYSSGYRNVISGYQDIMMGNAKDGTDDTLQNGNIPSSQGGKGQINKTDLSSVTMRMGIIYDGINNKIHILLTDFNTGQLKYVRTINNLDSKYFTQNSEGKVNFGLYAESAHSLNVKFFDIEYSSDQDYIESKFPEITTR